MVINIVNDQKKIDFSAGLAAKIKKASRLALNFEKAGKKSVITVCFTTNKIIKQLNKRYLGRDCSTDVIAFNMFPAEKGGCFNAEIAVSADKIISNAKIYKTPVIDELLLYVVHGILHVLGYDDRTKKQTEKMRKKEMSILNRCLDV